jgi:hypothetical protein
MRRHHDRWTARLVNAADQIEDHPAVFRIEIASRLVGEDQRGAMDDGAGDGDALHLAAGKLVREMCAAIAESDLLQHLSHARFDLAARHVRQRQRKGDVLEDVQRGDEIEELEDVADGPAPYHRQPRFVEDGGLDLVEQHPPRGWLVDGAHQVQQRRFTAARCAHQHGEIARGNLE